MRFALSPRLAPSRRYLALRAADRFYDARGRYPGSGAGGADAAALAADADAVWAELEALLTRNGLTPDPAAGKSPDDAEMTPADAAAPDGDGVLVPVSRDHAVEVTRYGAAELHNIAAIVGGVASQEAVKLITHQYVPINHTWLYNGISSLAAVLEV